MCNTGIKRINVVLTHHLFFQAQRLAIFFLYSEKLTSEIIEWMLVFCNVICISTNIFHIRDVTLIKSSKGDLFFSERANLKIPIFFFFFYANSEEQYIWYNMKDMGICRKDFCIINIKIWKEIFHIKSRK